MIDRALGAALIVLAGAAPAAAGGACVPSATVLCFHGDRFSVEVSYDATALPAPAVPMSSAATGYFWFDDARYPQLYVRILDGRALNGHWWVFLGSLTDRQFELEITDTFTNTLYTYSNTAGTRASFADTAAIPDPPVAAPAAAPTAADLAGAAAGGGGPAESSAVAGACVPSAETACLDGGRYAVRVRWFDPSLGHGVALAEGLTSHSAGFLFFSPATTDVVVEIIEESGPIVVYGAMSNLFYAIEVVDTVTGERGLYCNPQGNLAAAAHPPPLTVTPECTLFADGFESGDTTAWSSTTP